MKYLTILQQGGPVFVLIGICALVAAFVFVRKWFEFYRAQVNINEIVYNNNSMPYKEADKLRLIAYMRKVNESLRGAVTDIGDHKDS